MPPTSEYSTWGRVVALSVCKLTPNKVSSANFRGSWAGGRDARLSPWAWLSLLRYSTGEVRDLTSASLIGKCLEIIWETPESILMSFPTTPHDTCCHTFQLYIFWVLSIHCETHINMTEPPGGGRINQTQRILPNHLFSAKHMNKKKISTF